MFFRPRLSWWSIPASVCVTQGGMPHSHNLRLQPHTTPRAVGLWGRSLFSLQACFALCGRNKEPTNLTHDWNTICANQLSVVSAQICGHTYFISCHSSPKQIEDLEGRSEWPCDLFIYFYFSSTVCIWVTLLFAETKHSPMVPQDLTVLALVPRWQFSKCQRNGWLHWGWPSRFNHGHMLL